VCCVFVVCLCGVFISKFCVSFLRRVFCVCVVCVILCFVCLVFLRFWLVVCFLSVFGVFLLVCRSSVCLLLVCVYGKCVFCV